RNNIVGDVVLITRCQGTPVGAMQTDNRLASEQAAALGSTSVYQREAVFQLEDSTGAVAQILIAFQAPAVAILDALDQTNRTHFGEGVALADLGLAVTDTGINQTV